MIEGEGLGDENLTILDTPSYENIHRYVMNYVDGVIAGSPNADAAILDLARKSGKAVLEYRSPEEEGFYENYNNFYENLF